ncbi:hypothetical protein [Acinetobacter guerrae]|uniref:hypothetical protein n=1 Tax=Acinetobacter guerrae TaxID=1843371 RepID=UPI001FD16299|nr:hypothetical protein [Acinetobacter guerrae]
MLTINKILNLPHDFNVLVEYSVHEKFRFLKRLYDEFEMGKISFQVLAKHYLNRV